MGIRTTHVFLKIGCNDEFERLIMPESTINNGAIHNHFCFFVLMLFNLLGRVTFHIPETFSCAVKSSQQLDGKSESLARALVWRALGVP